MRIVHCLRAPVGGLFRHVLDLSEAQAQLGAAVGLIADSEAANALTEQKFARLAPSLTLGIARIPMPRLPGPGDLRAHRAITAELRALNVDVLHGHGAKGGAYARLAGRALKREGRRLKTFYTPHGGTLHFAPTSLEGAVYTGLEWLLDRVTDGLIFESAFAARLYGERMGQGGAPRRVIPNGLAPGDFIAVSPAADAADLLYIGELRALKGVDVLLHALALLNRTRSKPLSATIVGSGPDEIAFKSLTRELGLEPCVAFKGALPAQQAFALGRTLVVPSRKESFPYIVLEAAAAGLPLIATDVGGIPEIVAGTNTALVAPGDAAALSRAIEADITDPAATAARALRLKDAVAAKFSVTGMTRAVMGFYEEA